MGEYLFRVAVHNQGDRADSPAAGWDAQCLTERSDHPGPNWAERFTRRQLKGLAVDWNPDVLLVRHTRFLIAHPGVKKVTPTRGTLWVEGEHVPTGLKVAVVCSHRINDHLGVNGRSEPLLRRVLWAIHDRQDRRIVKNLERRGFVVFYGADVNDRTTELRPLERVLTGKYDALAHTPHKRVDLIDVTKAGRRGSDHPRYTATYRIN